MSSRRLLKAAAAVRQVVSMAILTDLKDPRVRDVTVTHVEMTPDMREAKVYVSIMGDATRQDLSLRGLQNARGFLQSKIAERIETRYTPRLRFVVDMGVKRSIEVAEILDRVLSEDKSAGEPAASDEPAAEDFPDEERAEFPEAEGHSETSLDNEPDDGDRTNRDEPDRPSPR
ncbi:MAG TPA: 30S ribosome-binding factor RbfA [Pirellulales bacterium]|jgi:ribosome-binding factor A|nr:30S ribosome-binding factor RbfA [Pirellulales bacterium]